MCVCDDHTVWQARCYVSLHVFCINHAQPSVTRLNREDAKLSLSVRFRGRRRRRRRRRAEGLDRSQKGKRK